MEAQIVEPNAYPSVNTPGLLARVLGMTYALSTYALGAGALFWLFFAAGGFAPYGLSEFATDNVPIALGANVVLVSLFALQHTIMARKSFKNWVTRFVPGHLERATFVLFSGIAMVTLVWFWQPLPGVVWVVSSTVIQAFIYCGFFTGIAYVLLTSLVTNHFELFGLRQAYLNLVGKPYTPLEFKRVLMYRYSRHPMMLGILMVLWFTPEMSVTRLCLAVLLTIYLFAGIKFEERGLIQEFGDKYREYKKEIGMFF